MYAQSARLVGQKTISNLVLPYSCNRFIPCFFLPCQVFLAFVREFHAAFTHTFLPFHYIFQHSPVMYNCTNVLYISYCYSCHTFKKMSLTCIHFVLHIFLNRSHTKQNHVFIYYLKNAISYISFQHKYVHCTMNSMPQHSTTLFETSWFDTHFLFYYSF